MDENSKSVYEVAKILGVSPQALYKRFNDTEFMNLFMNHIDKDKNGKLRIKSSGLEVLKEVYKSVYKSVDEPFSEPVDKQLMNDNESFINHLLSQNEQLSDELIKEREHSRIQAVRIADLADKMAELTKNNQVLLRLEQQQQVEHQNNNLVVVEPEPVKPFSTEVDKPKKSIWNFFKK